LGGYIATGIFYQIFKSYAAIVPKNGLSWGRIYGLFCLDAIVVISENHGLIHFYFPTQLAALTRGFFIRRHSFGGHFPS
jgi:hypothetical protein